MENDTVLKVENLSKKFCRTLKRSLFYGTVDIARSMFGINYDTGTLRKAEFWALDNLSLELKRGEILGVVGENGSGKSTLMRLITGIFPPDRGRISYKGRVGALIAVGAGFHPHMTGKENIYLNGTILGMTKKEINSKIDKIIEFADIGDFLEAPVNTYSSGMRVRLGFSIAVHCEPSILLVDEALAVGDIRFQQKCYRTISGFREKGITVLLCTHDIDAVLNFCSRCIWIHDGQIKLQGEPEEVIKKYHAYMFYNQEVKQEKPEKPAIKNAISSDTKIPWQSVDDCQYFGEGGATITDVCFYHEETGQTVNFLRGGEKVVLGVRYIANETLCNPIIGFNVKNSYGMNAFGTNTLQEKANVAKMECGFASETFFQFTFPSLANGDYSVDLAIADGTQSVHLQHCWKYDALSFKIENMGAKYSFGYVYVNSVKVLSSNVF